MDLTGLTPFYSSVLQAWQVFKFTHATNETPGMWLLEEPLFFNSFIRTQTLQSASLLSQSQKCWLHKTGSLMKMTTASMDILR